MANTLATTDLVVRDVARYFVNNLKGVAKFNRKYSDEFAREGGKVGDTVKVRLPQQWLASSGDAMVEQNILDQTVNVILNRRRHVGFGYTSSEETTDLEDIRTRYVMPAAETLANTYDRLSMADVYKQVWNSVGTPGSSPSAVLTWLQAKAKLLDFATPDEMICAVLDPWANAALVNTSASNFNPSGKISENWRHGQFAADQLGIAEWYNDQNIPRFSTGEATSASTPLINGAGQTGSSIVTDGWGSGATNLNAGDIVTFAGVYAVNPLSKESTGRLQQFTLTADVSDTTGDLTMNISPSIVTSGALQNVTASPANNAVLTFWGMSAGGTQAETVSPNSLVFHPEAFSSVMADLAMPNGGANASRVRSKEINISIRFVEQFNIQDDKNRSRLDILFGAAPIQERMACRVVG